MAFKKRILIYIGISITLTLIVEAFKYSLSIITSYEALGRSLGLAIGFCIFLEIVYRGWFVKSDITNAP